MSYRSIPLCKKIHHLSADFRHFPSSNSLRVLLQLNETVDGGRTCNFLSVSERAARATTVFLLRTETKIFESQIGCLGQHGGQFLLALSRRCAGRLTG